MAEVSDHASRTVNKTTEQRRFDQLVSLSPSAKLVFHTLEEDHPLTSQAIAEQSLLPKRTTRYALEKLGDADLVTKQVDLHDPRRRLYSPQPVEEYEN